MKRTALNKIHKEMGAKMVEFAGFEMPLYYKGIRVEHLAVRKSVGIFDVSHMGNIIVKGKDCAKFLGYVTPTNIEKLKIGDCVYTAFLNENGIIVDDTIISRFSENSFLVVPNAATTERIFEYLKSKSENFSVEIENVSSEISIIAIQGPCSLNLFRDVFSEEPPNRFKLKFYKYKSFESFTSEVFVSGTGYTGEMGVEVMVKNEYAEELWKELLDKGKRYSVEPCGLGARDTLRMEKGMLLSGQDFHPEHLPKTPLEAGLTWIIDFDHDFLGKDILYNMKKEKKYDLFRGFVCEGKRAPRHGFDVYSEDGEKIGIVTSGTHSPSLNIPIGLGYVRRGYHKPGTKVIIKGGRTEIPAEIRKPKLLPEEEKGCPF